MTSNEFALRVLANLPYEPNDQQVAVAMALARFCSPADTAERVFVLNGYAGTGKTTLTGALVRTLAETGISCVLLAPTGRAAKVFAAGAGRPAHTVHRRIYRHSLNPLAAFTSGCMVANNARDTLFIVDEASMIGGPDERGGDLLTDLIHYVYTGENCRLLLLGDTAQLPPVGRTESPAMSRDVLRGFGLKVTFATLTEVARQGAGSGILANATVLRRSLLNPQADAVPALSIGYSDVEAVTSAELPETIEKCYRADGIDETIVITRSNRSATEYNRAIRAQVLYLEEELSAGELLIVAKNNYHWTRKIKGVDFIANGDVVVVKRVYGTEVRYGFRFADVRLAFVDRDAEFDAKILLQTLHTDTAQLPHDRTTALYQAIMTDSTLFEPAMPVDLRSRALAENPHWNALNVKYAYAVTCHKAQGGQWLNVFIDLSYVPAEALGPEFYRWLYTAVTRARKKLYLINPPTQMLR